MKKILNKLPIICIVALLVASKTIAQNNCHALFSSKQDANTLNFNFTDLSSSQNTISSWSWDFGDGSTSVLQNPSHEYTHSGSFLVCLAIHDNHGCNDHLCQYITVNPIPHMDCMALFGFHQISNSLEIDFVDSSKSSNTITSWSWDFGDGSISEIKDPTHIYAHAGTYTVCLTIHDDHGCSHHICYHIIVNATSSSCHADFNFSLDSNSNIFTFKNTSIGTTIHTTYLWDFGNGDSSTEENPDYKYTHTGHYIVCLFIHDDSTGCSSHYCHEINYQHTNHHFHNVVEHFSFDAPYYSQNRLSREKVPISIYTNPISNQTTIQYELLKDEFVGIELYNLNACKVETISKEFKPKGIYTKDITPDFINGIYIVKIILDHQSYSRIISVVK
ncbi:MAG: PKD domain-containing protein [Saprospiraceae bacterium]